MLKYIVINPSEYRSNDFNIKGINNSRWQVDFYLYNECFEDCPDEYAVEYNIGSLHFTAYNLLEETPEQAYNALLNQLNYLLISSQQSQYIQSNKLFNWNVFECFNDNDPFSSFDYDIDTIRSLHMKSSIKFYELITGVKQTFNINNIDELDFIIYLYYSSLKWLSYGFDSNTTAFTDYSDFITFLGGGIELKNLQQHDIY